MKTALILVDIQNEYFPGGKNALTGSPEAARQAGRLLQAFRTKDLPRVHIQHIATRPGAKTFLPGTDGILIYPEVQPVEGEIVYQKHFPNSFRGTPLLDHLHDLGIERVVVAGMQTHMCVDATVRAAVDYGFQCWIAGNACATRPLAYKELTIPAEHVHGTILAALGASYGSVMDVDEIIEKLAS